MKNINPFLLEKNKFDVKTEKTFACSGDSCVETPTKFHKHICLPEYSIYQNGKNVLYSGVAETVWKHV